MTKTNIAKIFCLILALCLALTAFAGCNNKKDDVTSSEPVSSSEVTSSEEETTEDPIESSEPEDTIEDPADDDWLEELPAEEEEDVYYEELFVNNTKVTNNNFRGIGYIHQMASYYTDSYGRLYTDKQREYELEIMKNMGVKNIRAFYGSALTYNAETGEQDFNSEGMNEFIAACKAMDSIGIEVGATAIWTMRDLVDNEESNNTAKFGLGAPGIVVKDDWDATVRNYRNFMKNTVLTLKAHGVNNMKYFFAYTECNNTFTDDGLDINGEKAETSLDNREYERIYPLYDDLITALDGGLKDAGLRNQYKIVGPCDNWRADDGSEPISLLTKYTCENLADKVDIIGSHNGYDRANEYTDDMFYEIPPEKLTDPMKRAAEIGKEYWVDEYNVAVTQYGWENVAAYNRSTWKGVAVGAMMNSVMNLGGVSNLYLWTLWNEQWPDNTNSNKDGEFQNGIQICGYLECLFETATPLPAWYSVSLLTKYIGSGKLLEATGPEYGVYVSAIERDDGETTVVVTNYNYETTNVKIQFEKSMGGKTFYRYLYNSSTIEPASSSEMISADAVAKNVKTGFYDALPAGSVAVYSTVKPGK